MPIVRPEQRSPMVTPFTGRTSSGGGGRDAMRYLRLQAKRASLHTYYRWG